MRTLILLLAFSSLAIAQQTKSDLRRQYDWAEDKTVVSTKPRYLKETSVQFTAYFRHPGTDLKTSVPKAGLSFKLNSRDINYSRALDNPLYVVADGERFQFENYKRDTKVPEHATLYGRVNVNETVIFSVERETLAKLGNAKSVEVKLGTETYKLGKDTLESLKQLAIAMTPQP